MFSRGTRWPHVVLIVVVAAACSLFEDRELRVTATPESTIVVPNDPVEIEITARNTGDGRVEWGRGSSTCQLDLLVRVDGRDLAAAYPDRFCTADLVDHALAPGESRTERHSWAGHVVRNRTIRELQPGTYEIRGAAGSVAFSDPIRVEIRAGPES